jgi:hypothetical protein
VREPFDPEYLIGLCQQARRQRSLLRVEDLLEERTRALRESEAQLRALFRAIPDAVLVRNDGGVILQANAVAAQWLGSTEAELVGRNVDEFTQPATPLPIGPPPAGGPRIVEVAWVSATGERRNVEISEQRIEFRGRPAVFCVARDITMRTALLNQRADYLALLTNDIRLPLEAIASHAAALVASGQLTAAARDAVQEVEADARTVLQLISAYLREAASTS